MSDDRSPNLAWALLLARLVLGLIFFMAGAFKVFVLGPTAHVEMFFLPYEDTFLPTWSLWMVGWSRCGRSRWIPPITCCSSTA